MKLKEENFYELIKKFNQIDFSTEFAEIKVEKIEQYLKEKHNNKVVDFCNSFLKNKNDFESGIKKYEKETVKSNKYTETTLFFSRKIELFLKEPYPKEEQSVIEYLKEYNYLLDELKKIWKNKKSISYNEYKEHIGDNKEKVFKQIFPLSKLYNFFYFINEILSEEYNEHIYRIYQDIINKIADVFIELFEINEYRKEEKKLEVISRWYKKNFLEQYKNKDINPLFFIKYITDNYTLTNENNKKILSEYIGFYFGNVEYQEHLKNKKNKKMFLKIINNKKVKKNVIEKIKMKEIYEIMLFSNQYIEKEEKNYIISSLIQELDEWSYFDLDQQIIYQLSGNSEKHFIFLDWFEKFYPEKGMKMIDKIENLINKEDKSLFAFTSISENAFPVQKINKLINETRKKMEKSAIKSKIKNKEKIYNKTINRF